MSSSTTAVPQDVVDQAYKTLNYILVNEDVWPEFKIQAAQLVLDAAESQSRVKSVSLDWQDCGSEPSGQGS